MPLPSHTPYSGRFLTVTKPRLGFISGILFCVFAASSQAQRLTVQLNDVDGNPLSEVVIEVLLPEELKSAYQPSADTEVDQLDKEFVPSVSTMVVGNSVAFPNSDDILHHVYSFSPGSEFYIPLYGKGTGDDYTQAFSNAGVVEIGCNLHDWMLAYIYVAESSLNAVSDDSGQATIDNIPPGTFELRVWHSRLQGKDVAMTQMIEFVEGAQKNLEYTLELKRDRRIRRASSSTRTRYR